ncbi:16S rRNA (cytidine(1402)-2'-O)-methyltransferase [Candidatus Berkelbacteria bacterium]|uniref:Ribosomal RNA small subunit methyltransferase I n=1 Tax=Candidatus Berkelbacteria bacterium CG10_big_fil_rev_8_21_14_0_10_43_14 TaxID=1974515 RepID=A0A2M6R7W9_9BACT|nr:16S rRNA (cytidine(1402)-2'-O)-methyltransferase [Candidatus Berkelbacteria bacterium]OIP06213.1 MAG: 16S rRNA (cytidine(1402)-2'-O)-methyltransferase [Candidatus Berkelbacteria bacterium CG2_30_43_20]PIS06597.1 MAG: 16S rRNA (cytidine(1402)-2'-O)-methyltransferase [Candidatus Berkelbacteria bacterium CG10_big_fil_rev_8_21_14_0_10_43_14]PIU87459.1 MAG: 16S rRNA (cytidine(1402)-2'-O)-methyltransferase [Candidatus Berkelbacteria bacterium CG06_land_8_20_14_3_00_43_10]
MLYIVATPLGNLADITYRAVQILGSVDYIVAEDSRRTGLLTHHYSIHCQLITLHEHSKDDKIDWFIGELKSGKHAALVTDAGTPGIADPGGRVVEKAVAAGIDVSPIPGPSSLAAILSVTGWLNEPVLFLGYLPKKKGRKTLLGKLKGESIKDTTKVKIAKSERRDLLGSGDRLSRGGGGVVWKTLVFFESPHRINKTLQELNQYLGADCRVVIGRELTKQFEEIIRGTLGELSERKCVEKGEFVVAIHTN